MSKIDAVQHNCSASKIIILSWHFVSFVTIDGTLLTFAQYLSSDPKIRLMYAPLSLAGMYSVSESHVRIGR